jgi:hypothetical protein
MFMLTVFRAVLAALVLSLAAGPALAAATPAVPAYFHKYYSGKIGDKYAFKMELKSFEGVLKGNYQYVGKQLPIYLNGKIGAAGSFTMEEAGAYGGKSTGSFSGTVAGSRITGTWRSADGKRTLPFAADQTSEIVIGSKKDILSAAVGDYGLESIQGNGGANTLWETWKRDGRWESNISSNSGGTREGSMIKLTRADVRALDSMTIRVRPDLATEFLVNGKVILDIPYRDAGMHYKITPPKDPGDWDILGKLRPVTTVLDETLYLLAQDKVDYSTQLAGNFNASVNGSLVVSYSIVDSSFELAFKDEQCCGGSTLRFIRRGKPAAH